MESQNPMNEQEPHAPATERPGAPAGNTNARFWGRHEVETARLLLDVWATQVWHSLRVVVPVHEIVVQRIPIFDERSGREVGERLAFETVSRETGQSYDVSGDHRPMAIDERISGDVVIEHHTTKPFRDRGLCPALEIKVMVAAELSGLEAAWAAWAEPLMLHLYPRSGPYHDPARCLDQFRPEELVTLLREGYEGKDPNRFITSQLNIMHKAVVGRLIPLGQSVLGRGSLG